MEFQILDRSVTQEGSRRTVTEQGYLAIEDCVLARSGILEYAARNFQPHAFNDRAPTEMIRVFRPVIELEKSAASFSGAPVTDEHPGQMLTPENTKFYQRGHVNGEAAVKDGRMRANLIMTNTDTVTHVIKENKNEISNGYFSRYDFKAGIVPDNEPIDAGQSYDCIQLGLRGNHVALVKEGRCGAECRVSDSNDNLEGNKNMATVTINGVSYEASEQVAQAVGVLQTTMDSITTERNNLQKEQGNFDSRVEDEVTKRTGTLQATLDTKDGELTAAQAAIPTADRLDEMVQERVQVVAVMASLDSKFDVKGKSNEEIQKAAVAKAYPGVSLDGKNADFISGLYQGISPKGSKGKGTLDSALSSTLDSNNDNDETVVLDAREKSIQAKRDRFNKK